MNITYEFTMVSNILNATIEKGYVDGIFKFYAITPSFGYVLHDSAYDYIDFDGNLITCYRQSEATCAANYDFVTNPRGFYTVPEHSVSSEVIL